jgi:undecaprenyl diphosphate synthase
VSIPKHIAVIMDGNGRWAKRRLLPRTAGHKRGVDAVRTLVEAVRARGIGYLTLFAFSSENWRRPHEEVSTLMELFAAAITREAEQLLSNGVRLRFIGDRSRFGERLQASMSEVEQLTAGNDGLHLTVAVNYGGRWDILQAAQRAAATDDGLASEQDFARHLSLAFAPELDLLIRSGGEHRISNFLLWQCAYAELFFTETLWPDFCAQDLDEALEAFAQRERRFGQVSEQLAKAA